MKKNDIRKNVLNRIKIDLIIMLLISSSFLMYTKGIPTFLTLGISSILGNTFFGIVLYFILIKMNTKQFKLATESQLTYSGLVKNKIYIDMFLIIFGILIYAIFDVGFLYELSISSLIILLAILMAYKKNEYS